MWPVSMKPIDLFPEGKLGFLNFLFRSMGLDDLVKSSPATGGTRRAKIGRGGSV
jgi:hypothetical protein